MRKTEISPESRTLLAERNEFELVLRNHGAIAGIGTIKSATEVTGSRTKVKVVKNKVAPPFRAAEFDILYGSGISKEGELVDMASEHNIIEKLGAWYSYDGERIGQGRENARDFFNANPTIADEIEAKLRQSSRRSPSPVRSASIAPRNKT